MHLLHFSYSFVVTLFQKRHTISEKKRALDYAGERGWIAYSLLNADSVQPVQPKTRNHRQ
ncbi:hypothetical protein EB077_04000 [bacterium]|nr:hypothetical protein [bacterium]